MGSMSCIAGYHSADSWKSVASELGDKMQFTKEMCERLLCHMILEDVLSEFVQYNAYATNGYIKHGPNAAVVISGVLCVTMQVALKVPAAARGSRGSEGRKASTGDARARSGTCTGTGRPDAAGPAPLPRPDFGKGPPLFGPRKSRASTRASQCQASLHKGNDHPANGGQGQSSIEEDPDFELTGSKRARNR